MAGTPPREVSISESSPEAELILESETATKNEHAYENESKTPSSLSAVQLTDQTNLLPFRQVVAVFMALSLCVVVSALDSGAYLSEAS